MNEQVKKLREDLTNRLISEMDKGQDWIQPWLSERPVNAVSGRKYHGMNILYLQLSAMDKGYKDPRWCTYIAAQKNGWQVRRGEKATAIEFWQEVEVEEENPETGEKQVHTEWRGKKNNVFNAEQIDGIPALEEFRQEFNPDYDALANDLIESSECPVREDQEASAYYSPKLDFIHVPLRETFKSSAAFVSTLLHEMGHSTGHPDRLARDMIVKMATGKPLTEYVSALQENGLYRYYCYNVLQPGTLPKVKIINMVPFDERQVIDNTKAEKATKAWGYIEVEEPLESELQKNFDLTPAKGSQKKVSIEGNNIDNYPAEELVAEFASAFMEAELNVEEHHGIENHGAYLESWGKEIKKDPEKLFAAIKAADKAADRVLESYNKYLEKKPDKAEDVKEERQEEEQKEQILSSEKEPVVKIVWSENSNLKEGDVYPLSKANELFKTLDDETHAKEGHGYDKTKFQILYMKGESNIYEGRYDIGDGEGYLIDHIINYNVQLFDSGLFKESLIKEYGKEEGEKAFELQKKESRDFILFLQKHLKIAETERVATLCLEKINAADPNPDYEARKGYYQGLLDYCEETRKLLASGSKDYPEQPKLDDYLEKKPEKPDKAAELSCRLEAFVNDVMHANGSMPAASFKEMLESHQVDGIIAVLDKLNTKAADSVKDTIRTLKEEVQQFIQVKFTYQKPVTSIQEFAESHKIVIDDTKELNEELLKQMDNMDPLTLKKIDAIKQAKTAYVAAVKAGTIKVQRIEVDEPMSKDAMDKITDGLMQNIILGDYRSAKELLIGKEIGIFHQEEMLPTYSPAQKSDTELDREIFFDYLTKTKTPGNLLSGVLVTNSVEPYMIPHIAKAVSENKQISFKEFNRLCDLKDPSKVYEPPKAEKGTWLNQKRQNDLPEAEEKDKKRPMR